GNDVGTKEPVGYVDMPDPTLDNGAKEHNGISHPHQGDQDIKWPLELGIFLGAGVAKRQGDDCTYQDRLPSPEGERSELVAEQARLTGALNHVVRGSKQATAAKRKDDGVGVQGAQASVGQPGGFKVQFRPDQLGSDENPHRHPNDSPEYGGNGEL